LGVFFPINKKQPYPTRYSARFSAKNTLPFSAQLLPYQSGKKSRRISPGATSIPCIPNAKKKRQKKPKKQLPL